MSIGAVVIPLVALAICLGGMWFAWRLVGRSDEADGNQRQQAAPPSPAQPTAAVGVQRAGPFMAFAGVSLGIFGVASAIARRQDADSPLLVAAVLSAGFFLLASGIWLWRVRRRARRSGAS